MKKIISIIGIFCIALLLISADQITQTQIEPTNIGTAATGTTALEYGDQFNHVTKLTVSTTLPAIVGGTNLGLGVLVYTLPTGACLIEGSQASITLTAADGNIDADTPEVGIGTVIASGAVTALNGTATFENILTGQAATDCSGTATVKGASATAGVLLEITSAGAHTIYINVADGWAASGETACPVTATIYLFWKYIG